MSILQFKGYTTAMLNLIERLPVVSFYARTRGWPFILTWAHRLTGILLVVFVWVHIYTLSFLSDPVAYAEKIRMYGVPLLGLLEWALALPVIFHVLNGGRLILYESFQFRRDDTMIRWVLGLCALYVGLLAVLMLTENQSVSAPFFWLVTLSLSLAVTYGLLERMRETAHAKAWKLQRISGSFLLVMIPAHLLFMHLNSTVAKDPSHVIARLQNPLIKLTDIVLVLAVLYHGGYGLLSIASDYLYGRRLRKAATAAIAAVMAVFAWLGIQLLLPM